MFWDWKAMPYVCPWNQQVMGLSFKCFYIEMLILYLLALGPFLSHWVSWVQVQPMLKSCSNSTCPRNQPVRPFWLALPNNADFLNRCLKSILCAFTVAKHFRIAKPSILYHIQYSLMFKIYIHATSSWCLSIVHCCCCCVICKTWNAYPPVKNIQARVSRACAWDLTYSPKVISIAALCVRSLKLTFQFHYQTSMPIIERRDHVIGHINIKILPFVLHWWLAKASIVLYW